MVPLRKKLVMVGDDLTGKTSVLLAYGDRLFRSDYVPTVMEHYTTSVTLDDEVIELVIWDTAGKKEYDCLRPLSYCKADVILICFSIDNPESFINVAEKWSPEVHHYGDPEVPVLLVGNKKDMRYDLDKLEELKELKQKPISPSEGHIMAGRIRAFCYLECSAVANEGITEVIRVAALASIQKKILPKVKKSKCMIL